MVALYFNRNRLYELENTISYYDMSCHGSHLYRYHLYLSMSGPFLSSLSCKNKRKVRPATHHHLITLVEEGTQMKVTSHSKGSQARLYFQKATSSSFCYSLDEWVWSLKSFTGQGKSVSLCLKMRFQERKSYHFRS